MPKLNAQEIKNKIISIQNELNKVLLDLDVALGVKMPNAALKARAEGTSSNDGESRIVEGVFDGQAMVGADGKQYSIPANYASKSKLIEGDMLKLTIQGDGTFLFKQIGPIERERLVGVLAFDEQEKQFFGVANGKSYMLLTASVTYYKGETGDEVILLVPENGESTWAAVENIVKQASVQEAAQKTVLDGVLESVEVPDIRSDKIESEVTSLQDELKKTVFDEPTFASNEAIADEEDDEFKII